MLARRGPQGIGSFGASAEFYTKVNLQVADAEMRINRNKRQTTILRNGMWAVKKLGFNTEDLVRLSIRVTGSGTGFLFTSFDNGDGPELLAIQKVTTGLYRSDFIVPEPVLRNFKIGISTTVPKGHGVKYLPNKERYSISKNSLMLSQSRPTFQTTGLGGLGTIYEINDDAVGGVSHGVELWKGDISKHSFKIHRFQGQSVQDHSAGEGPEVYTNYNRHYICRSAFYGAVFDFEGDGSFLGWSNIDGLHGTEGIPAGTPICLVSQNYQYKKKVVEHWYGDDDISYSFRIVEPGHEPFEKLFFTTTESADAITQQYSAKNGLVLTSSSGATLYRGSIPTTTGKATPSRGHYSATGQSIYPQAGQIDEGTISDNKITPTATAGRHVKVSEELAIKLEWYDESSKSWSQPMAQPPTMPTCNNRGKTKIIFRFPRQLDPKEDKTIYDELLAHGVDYSFEKTKQVYPRTSGDGDLYYRLIGRPLGPDGKEVRFVDQSGEYRSHHSISPRLMVQYKTQSGTGIAGDPGYIHVIGSQLQIVDGEKLAKLNYPELYTNYYAAGEFNCGDTIFAIGKGFSTKSMSVISTKKGDSYWDVVERHDLYDENGVMRSTNIHDGSMIGTRDADILRPAGVIDADQVASGELANHADLDTVWKKVMGSPLTEEYFRGAPLPDQDPENKLHYLQRDAQSGDIYSFPYQIIWYNIPMNYMGPYVDYEATESEDVETGKTNTTYKIIKPEDKEFARSEGESMWLNTTTPFHQKSNLKIIISDEMVVQRNLEASGLDPATILHENDTDHTSINTTKEEAQEDTEQEYLLRMAQVDEDYQPGSGDKYVKTKTEAWFSFGEPEDFAWESELKEGGFMGLGGFTNSRNYMVEDVTDKWGAKSIGSALPEGTYSTELMPESNPDVSGDPMLGFGAIGAFGDIFDSSEENLQDAIDHVKSARDSTIEGAMGATRSIVNMSRGKIWKGTKQAAGAALNVANADKEMLLAADELRKSGMAYVGESVYDAGEDLVDWGSGQLSGRSLNGFSAHGLSGSDSWGTKTKHFLTDLFVPDSLSEEFAKHPIGYTLGAAALVTSPLWVGPIFTSAAPALPAVAKAVVRTPFSLAVGAIDGVKDVVTSINSPHSRGTVARRGLTFKRGTASRRRRS